MVTVLVPHNPLRARGLLRLGEAGGGEDWDPEGAEAPPLQPEGRGEDWAGMARLRAQARS